MRTARNIIVLNMLLALLFVPAAMQGQEQEQLPERGRVELGARGFWGDVYGRPDLPFSPSLKTSKYNEYRDLRDGFFIRRAQLNFEDLLGTKNYFHFQSQKAIYRDQSYLATFGQYNKFKLQFRYDEIPHLYSNTARTLYDETAPGVFTISNFTRASLQAISSSTSLPSTIQTQIVPGMSFITPRLERKTGTVLFGYNLTPDWTVQASFAREHDQGTRPFAMFFNSSPSATLTSGYGVEVPEPIRYFTNTVTAQTEYDKDKWGVQFGYLGSFFQNSLSALVFDNPFRTSDCVAPTGCTAANQGPSTGRAALYPDNSAHYLTFAGAFDLTKNIRGIASISPGWVRQDDDFLPYTSNSILLAQTGALPAASLHGREQTLAMNYTLIARLAKNFEVKGGYRHYDFNNNTPIYEFTPVQGDIAAPNLASPTENHVFGFNKKNIEVTGNYYFWKKSSAKIGYEGEIFDRSHRDVAHSMENGLVAAIDLVPRKDLSIHATYRHSSRTPDEYEDEESLSLNGGIPSDHPLARRYDEAARLRNRGDVQVVYDATDRLSFSAFAGTLQDDFNRRAGVNSPGALNFLAGTTPNYYLYGLLKDLSYNAGMDADFAVTNEVTFFAEYSYERYNRRMMSRYRVPGGATPLPMDCSASGKACDSANNDWESTARDRVHIVSFGTDMQAKKKFFFSTYYSLAGAIGNVYSRPVGDPTLTTGPNKFLLTGTNAAVDYPETVNRNHEVSAIFRYKLSKSVTPKIEYRYTQYDNKDYQTSAMTPYMGCVSGLTGTPVPGCTSPLIGAPSPFYPYFVVGDTSAARFLFLGADQPSYKAHYLAGSVEFRF